jgi:hypothetical protein
VGIAGRQSPNPANRVRTKDSTTVRPSVDRAASFDVGATDAALLAYLQRTIGNHAVNQLIQRHGNRPASWLGLSGRESREAPNLSRFSSSAAPGVPRADAGAPEPAPKPSARVPEVQPSSEADLSETVPREVADEPRQALLASPPALPDGAGDAAPQWRDELAAIRRLTTEDRSASFSAVQRNVSGASESSQDEDGRRPLKPKKGRVIQRAPDPETAFLGNVDYLTAQAAITGQDWKTAFLRLNHLNMYDLIRAMSTLDQQGMLEELWKHKLDAAMAPGAPGNAPPVSIVAEIGGPVGGGMQRLEYAKSVVQKRQLPVPAPGDLEQTGQVDVAVDYLTVKKPTDADKVFGYRLAAIPNDAKHHLTGSFIKRLQNAEMIARRLVCRNGEKVPETAADWGVNRISNGGGGFHVRGAAIDINYDTCPYIMHEAGEKNLDKQLGPVYERISKILLGAESVVPTRITTGGNKTTTADTSNSAGDIYDKLKSESDAMKKYFSLLSSPDADLAQILDDFRKSSAGTAFPDLKTPDDFRRQIARDYLTLGGTLAQLFVVAGPQAGTVKGYGLKAPAAVQQVDAAGNPVVDENGQPKMADRPFNAKNSGKPEGGFVNIRKEIVLALTQAGMRWGAAEMGGASGDIMHFDSAADAR